MKPVPDEVALVMVNLDQPEFVRVSDCVWLLPTETLPKLMLEGFTVSCPEPADAGEVKARTTEKKKNKRNPHEISLHLDIRLFTVQPLMPC